MERPYTRKETLTDLQIDVLNWTARRVGYWMKTAIVKNQLAPEPRLRAYAHGASALYEFGGIPIKFLVDTYDANQLAAIDPDNDPARMVRRFQQHAPERERQYVEFAYTRPETADEKSTIVEPTFLVKEYMPYLQAMRAGVNPYQQNIHILPQKAKIALEVTAILAGMHAVAASHGFSGNLAYFYSGITIAANPILIAEHISGVTNIPIEEVGDSLGADFLRSPGIQEVRAIRDQVLMRKLLDDAKPNDDLWEVATTDLLNNPMKFVFARARIMPRVVAREAATLEQNRSKAAELFVENYTTNQGRSPS